MTIAQKYSHQDLIANIFCIIDDLLNMIGKLGKRIGRKASLSASEVVSIHIFGKMLGFKTLSAIYWHIRNYHLKDFALPSYKSFVELTNKHSQEALLCLAILMNFNWRNTASQCIQFIDSTCIAVCTNKRIFDHKVCKDVAQRGKSTMGWFYGFKLHIITDEAGNLLRISLSPGNTDDRTPVIQLAEKLTGVLVGDAGYVSEPIRNKLLEQWLHFPTGVRGNMKKLMTKWQHKLLKARQIVETTFSILKWSEELVSSLSRSVNGHFARIVYALLTYTVWKSLNREQIWIS